MERKDNDDTLSSSSDEDLVHRTTTFQRTSHHAAMLKSSNPALLSQHTSRAAELNADVDPAEPGPSTSGHTTTMTPNPKSSVESLGLRVPPLTLTRNNQRSEKSRLESFAGYPASPSMDIRQMASAGFYYTKFEDIVRCAFCGVEVGRWEEGDNPVEEHRKWSKYCRFLNGADVGNIPVDPADPPPLPRVEVNLGVDECGLYGIKPRDTCAIIPSLEKLGINKRYDPVHPSYSSLEARLESYSSWPVALKLRPQELAEAGFFYTGLGDKTACFQCGGGLKDWEEDDDPWREHALFFSKCSFVLQTKGREFVAEVLGKKPPTLTPEEIQALKIPSELNVVVKQHSHSSTETACSSSNASQSKSEEESESSSKSLQETESRSLPAQSVEEPQKKIEDARACKICFQEEIGVVFLPCGHLVACPKCASSISTCAVCRNPFNATVRAFFS